MGDLQTFCKSINNTFIAFSFFFVLKIQKIYLISKLLTHFKEKRVLKQNFTKVKSGKHIFYICCLQLIYP